MKFIAGILILGLFCGCASIPCVSKEELSRVEMSLDQKELQIRELEAILARQEAQIKGKDSQIQQLEDKLRSFGVF